MPAQPKAARSGKDWYSVSVDTLKGWGLLLFTLVVLGIGFLVWRVYDQKAVERRAASVIEEAGGLLQRFSGEKKAASYATDLAAARQSLEAAQERMAAKDFRKALENGLRSRAMLLLVRDQISPNGATGQAHFLSIQGEVEFRRAEGGASDWQEARTRGQLQPGDYVRTSGGGSAEIMFADGTLYTVRPNTQFIVAAAGTGASKTEQSIEMEYGWINLSTSPKSTSNVKTPGAVARVREDSEGFVAVDKGSSRGRFGAFRGGMELASKGGLTREVKALQEVVQTGDLLSEPKPLPGSPALEEPADNRALDLDSTRRLVLAWSPVPGASRYALQVSRNRLFVDNVIDAGSRAKTRATLGVRGEGAFLWRVAALSPEGLQGPWSEPRRFRIASSRTPSGEKKDTIPPELDLDDVKTYGSIFIVAGKSEPGARVEVNGEQVKTQIDGSFNKPVQLTKEGWNVIEVSARDAWGNETVRRHRVFVENS